jgi:hypothetical protein
MPVLIGKDVLRRLAWIVNGIPRRDEYVRGELFVVSRGRDCVLVECLGLLPVIADLAAVPCKA